MGAKHMPVNETFINDLISLCKLCSQIILENGGETYRAEETVNRLCKSFALNETEVIALPTGLFISVKHNGTNIVTTVKRIKKRTVDLGAIDFANNLSRQVVSGQISVCQAYELLSQPKKEKSVNRFLFILAAGLSSGCFSLLFNGTAFDFAAATLCGMAVQLLASYIKLDDMFNFAVSILGGMLIGLGSILSVRIFGTGDLDKIITGAMMPLLPGISMTNAIRDTIRGDLVSGVARGAEALLVALSLAFGVGVMLRLFYI